jgi:hypothetical protein
VVGGGERAEPLSEPDGLDDRPFTTGPGPLRADQCRKQLDSPPSIPACLFQPPPEEPGGGREGQGSDQS